MADRTRPDRALGRRGQTREHPVHPGGGSRLLGRSIYTPSCACAVRLTSSTSNTVACSGRDGGGQPAQGILETIAWYQGEGHLLQDRLVRHLAPVVGQRHLGRVRALRLQLPRPLPAGRFRAGGSGLPGEQLVLVVAGDVVVRLVVTAHVVACHVHGEDLARAGDALRLLGGADEARAVELSVSRGIGQHVEDVLCRCVDGARDHDLVLVLVLVLCHLLIVAPTGRYGNPMPCGLSARSGSVSRTPRSRTALRQALCCGREQSPGQGDFCLLYTSDASDDL